MLVVITQKSLSTSAQIRLHEEFKIRNTISGLPFIRDGRNDQHRTIYICLHIFVLLKLFPSLFLFLFTHNFIPNLIYLHSNHRKGHINLL